MFDLKEALTPTNENNESNARKWLQVDDVEHIKPSGQPQQILKLCIFERQHRNDRKDIDASSSVPNE